MKKLLLLLPLMATCFCISAQGEEEEDKKKKKAEFLCAIYGGFNFSGINGDGDSWEGNLFGGHFGVGATLIQPTDLVRVRAEVGYSMQGGKYSYNTESDYEPVEGSGKVRLGYINVPITARYQTPGGFFAEAGVQTGFLISAKDKYDVNGNSGSGDIKNQLNKVDVGIPVGIGYESKNGFGIGARVTPGLSNINKETTYNNNKDRNFTASLRGSYTF